MGISMNQERKLSGPGSYEKYNRISILSQSKYLLLLKSQIYSLLFIALLSSVPSFSEYGIDKIKHFIELFFILVVLILMIYQYKSNNMQGWQNARYLAESTLSNAWLFVWRCEPYNIDQKSSMVKFIDTVEKLEHEVDIKPFLSLVSNNEDEISDWMIEFRNHDLENKKKCYKNHRLNDQINWYTKKANYNQRKSTLLFCMGLILMGAGALLTILVIYDKIPDWAYLGFFTTVAVSVFTWFQTKRHDELRITYSVSAQELTRFKEKFNIVSDEMELVELVENIEKSISREHKLWLVKSNSF